MMMRCLCTMLLVCAVVGPVVAESWSVTNLHPASAAYSYGESSGFSQLSGYARVGANNHAIVWDTATGAFTDLNPSAASQSRAYGVGNGVQVGYSTIGGQDHAGFWLGSSSSWTDLNPGGSIWSVARGTSGSQQVGCAQFGSAYHAILWNSSSSDYIDLNPTGSNYSLATSIWVDGSESQQGGFAFIGGHQRAMLWDGTLNGRDITPDGSLDAHINAVGSGVQTGAAVVSGASHAGRWSGTKYWLDLNPTGADYSEGLGTAAGIVVGYAAFAGKAHAGMWDGTANSWFDLQSLLSSDYTESQATGIGCNDSGNMVISGYAYNRVTNRYEAVEWTSGQLVPEGPTSFALCVVSFGLAARLIKNRWADPCRR